MPNTFDYTLLPDDPALLTTLRTLARQWLTAGLRLHPTADGGLTYGPKAGLTPARRALIQAMQPYKALLLAIVQSHPAIALLHEESGPPEALCPDCLTLLAPVDGHYPPHRHPHTGTACHGGKRS